MGKTAETKVSSSQCFSKLSLLCVAVAVVFLFPSLIFVCFGFSPFLVTVSILCLSSIFLLSKKKSTSVNNPYPPENQQDQQVEEKVNQEMEAVTLCSNTAEVSDFHDYQVESTDCPSASESSDDLSASDGFELNWSSFNNVGKNVTVSEIFGSSDNDEDEDEDDNLIEISFPDNSSVEFNDESEAKMQTELPGYLRQEGLMELLKEINEVTEEENLIEIDLSMGSIKGQHL